MSTVDAVQPDRLEHRSRARPAGRPAARQSRPSACSSRSHRRRAPLASRSASTKCARSAPARSSIALAEPPRRQREIRVAREVARIGLVQIDEDLGSRPAGSPQAPSSSRRRRCRSRAPCPPPPPRCGSRGSPPASARSAYGSRRRRPSARAPPCR